MNVCWENIFVGGSVTSQVEVRESEPQCEKRREVKGMRR